MPISPAYEWSETALTLTVKAECRGATSSATDVYSSPHYVSANAPPYFLELDLHGAIDGTRSVANVSRGVVSLKLFKAAEGKWGRLLVDLPRAERLKRREASRALAAQEAEAAVERKKRANWDDSRFSLGHHMDKERVERARIDEYKAAEAAAAAASLDSWQAEAEATAAAQGLSNSKAAIESKAGRVLGAGTANKNKKSEPASPSPGKAAAKGSGKAAAKASGKPAGPVVVDADEPCGIVDITDDAPPLAGPGEIDNTIFDDDDEEEEVGSAPASQSVRKTTPLAEKSVAANGVAKASEAAAKAAAAAALPPPRSAKKITLSFTKQLLTAPARTKTTNADYDLPLDPLTAPEMFKNKIGSEGDISTRDPAWLKDRGDRYFRMGDARSAEEAYSLVLGQFAQSIMGQAIDCVTACYSNRAACRLQRKSFLEAADDCGHALAIMSKARCVTEYPKTEDEQKRCRMRLLSRRGAAYAHAGVLHRALTDLRRAAELADGNMPSDAADKQMLQTDAARVAERHDELVSQLEKADKLLAAAQPPAVRMLTHEDGEGGEGGAPVGGQAAEDLREARGLYDAALKLASREVGALANRAACSLHLGEPSLCVADCTAALAELDAEAHRTEEHKAEFTGMFAVPALAAELTALTDAVAEKTPAFRFDLLRRRAAARVAQGEIGFPAAATDLKAALKLRPAEPSVVMALDSLARRAAAANVELEPLPPALPPPQGLEYSGDVDEDEAMEEEDGSGDEAGEAEAGGDGEAMVVAAPGGASSKPPVGTRTAAQLKAEADQAFGEARLGKAVTLLGKALKADAAAEWLGEGRGILFRCQCLANRSACHLKLGAFTSTVDDAGAAIAALGTGLVSGDQRSDADALMLKLLARRGMALCQLTKYDEAAADYARAVEIDPDNEQLQADLRMIQAAAQSA